MAFSYIRKLLFTTLGLSRSVLLNLNTSGFALALQTSPSLSTNTNSSTYTARVQPKNNNLKWVYSVVERVIRANGLDEHPWRFQISDDYEIDAYADELNKIVIYKGLLDQIHGDDAALAFIIGHELAHHTQRHLVQKEGAEASLKEKLLTEAQEDKRIKEGDTAHICIPWASSSLIPYLTPIDLTGKMSSLSINKNLL